MNYSTITEVEVTRLTERVQNKLIEFEDIGLGEIGDCYECAAELVSDWIAENKIQVI